MTHEKQDLFDPATRPAFSTMDALEARAPETLRAALHDLREALFEPEPDSPALDSESPVGRDLMDFLRDETGMTPQELLRELRLETVAWFLILSDLTLPEIGEQVGHFEPSSLRRAFKRWSGGLRPREFRDRFRQLAADGLFADYGGVPPANTFSAYAWYRLEHGRATDAEVEERLGYLKTLYPSSEDAPGGVGDLLLPFVEELAECLGELPWPEQRRLVRESVRFSTAHFFDHLCALSRRILPPDRERATQLMVLAIDSLEATESLIGEHDAARAALAWTRLAYTRWRQGDLAGAEQALGTAAAERAAEPAEPVDRCREAETAWLAAGVLWGLGRHDAAVERADLAVESLVESRCPTCDVFLQNARILRAAIHSYAPRKPHLETLVPELADVRERLHEETGDEQALELEDLWSRLHLIKGDADEMLRSAARMQSLAHRAGDELARCRGLWYEGFAHRLMGDARRAESRWREARLGLMDFGMRAEAAPATLEIAIVCVSAGRAAEAAVLAKDLAETFETCGLDRDTLSVVTRLRRSLSRDELSLEDLKPLRRLVVALERDAKAKRGLGFEL